MKKGKVPQKEKKFSIDRVMLNMASHTVRDFQRNLDDFTFCSDFLEAINQGVISEIRECTPQVDASAGLSPDVFKATYQLASIFKRHRFRKDLYSDEELEGQAIAKFLECQSRLSEWSIADLDAKTRLVIDFAKRYVAKVLGPYSDEEHRSLCRFGRKASVGVPARLACEAARWELPLSGSAEQIAWFDAEMRDVAMVQEYWARQLEKTPKGSIYEATSSLTLTLVPKTFKSLRAIMPNTTVGSYMSYGLGEMIRKRLKREGFDIRRLQMRHRVLAQMASTIPNNGYVTLDLSSASDSISVALVELLFPADWLKILHQSRIGTVTLPDGRSVESETFCTMGIGYTFPLQTLVFLALLKGVQAVYYHPSDRRLISVYGDDMIFASRMYTKVLHHLKQLGFVINEDKTFATGAFRESCGGDYYHGVDVRPFQPRSDLGIVGSKAYEAILYKLVNGLLARWSEYEVGGTLAYLLAEIEKVAGKVKIVPGDYPDDSGVKCCDLGSLNFLRGAKVASPKHIGHGVYRFSYLKYQPKTREERRHDPYYWAALRGGLRSSLIDYRENPRPNMGDHAVVHRINEQLVPNDAPSPLLWAKSSTHLTTLLCGEVAPTMTPFVTISHSGVYTRQSGISCFGIRR